MSVVADEAAACVHMPVDFDKTGQRHIFELRAQL
jgi:hypothetical protein